MVPFSMSTTLSRKKDINQKSYLKGKKQQQQQSKLNLFEDVCASQEEMVLTPKNQWFN